jgi:hypothetical protein
MNQNRTLLLFINAALLFYIILHKTGSRTDQVGVILNENELIIKKSKWSELTKSCTLRDFNRYPCKELRRIGGIQQHVAAAQDPLYRIDGAWYVCFDEFLKPTPNSCLIYSFGIHHDEAFDFEMNQKYGCHVHSFDPFIESGRFAAIRSSNQKLSQAFEIKVNEKWSFYRIGLQGARSNLKIPQDLKINSFLNFDEILELTGKKNQVIDIFKMDIEGAEKSIFETIDMHYFCKYVKQFALETHPEMRKEARRLMAKLEKCFYLYYRDTRFYMHEKFGPTGFMTEFQLKSENVSIELASFRDEIEMADYMFTMGELYFVNLNFLEGK